MTNFKIGQKVVCVDDSQNTYREPNVIYYTSPPNEWVVKGTVYTIRDIFMDDDYQRPCVLLEEIYRPMRGRDMYEPGFVAARFRPLVKTSIDVFKRMLNKSPSENQREVVQSEIKELEGAGD